MLIHTLPLSTDPFLKVAEAGAAEPPQKKARIEAQADQEPTVMQEATQPMDAAQEQPVEAQEPVKDEPPQAVGARIEPQGEARKIPLSDLETLRQIADIRGGCCICTLRSGPTPPAKP